MLQCCNAVELAVTACMPTQKVAGMPQASTSVRHMRPAALSGCYKETGVSPTALDITLALPSSSAQEEEQHLNNMRRAVRNSSESHDCAEGPPSDSANREAASEIDTAEVKRAEQISFRSRRLSHDGNDASHEETPSVVIGPPTAVPAAAPPSHQASLPPTDDRLVVAEEFAAVEDFGIHRFALGGVLDDTNVALLSCHGAKPTGDGRHAVDKINQDCACVASGVGGLAGAVLFCVYDGHGDRGREVSQCAMRRMHSELDGPQADGLKHQPTVALASAFATVQQELRAGLAGDATDSGACSLVCYMRDRTLWVANAGDCRAVLGTVCDGVLAAVALSTDHKVSVPSEAARIRRAGGHIKMTGGPWRVYEDEEESYPGLSPSRALGDCGSSSLGVVATPEVTTHSLSPHDRFLILASDGLWEFIDSHEAVAIVDAFHSEGKPVAEACSHLVATAALAWLKIEGAYRDDISASVVWLQPVAEALDRALDRKAAVKNAELI